MKFKIQRLRKVIGKKDDALFVDILFEDLGITLKGITYFISNGGMKFPYCYTQNKVKYSPLIMTKEAFEIFKKELHERIQDEKMPKETEEVNDEQKKKILDSLAAERSPRKIQGRLSRQKKTHCAAQSIRSKTSSANWMDIASAKRVPTGVLGGEGEGVS